MHPVPSRTNSMMI